MSSCGNPSAEAGALMPRRVKFDKSRTCVKCKAVSGNVVIRQAVYCKECFFDVVITKFKRTLGPRINPPGDGYRKGSYQASGNLLIGLSGGLGSTVLLDIVTKCYFRPLKADDERPRGGTSHPHNGSTWSKVAVCYVEVCSAFPDMRDRTNEVRAMVEQYKGFEFVPFRIENAFDPSWWELVGGSPIRQNLGVDVTNEDLLLSSMTNASTPISSLHSYIASLPTQTAVSTAVQNLVRLILLHCASSTKSSHLLLGTSLTSLSIALISSIAQGGGFAVREEAEEEWKSSTHADTNGREYSDARRGVLIIRPLKEVGMKECALWAWWADLKVVGQENVPGAKQGIGGLTKNFIMGLERDYPSTVSAITRTCGKLTPKEGTDGSCPLCERSVQRGIRDWKARISIRSLAEPQPLSDIQTDKPKNSLSILRHQSSPQSQHLAPYLCYACHTTLSSRSSRGIMSRHKSPTDGQVNSSGIADAAPLPVWVESRIVGYSESVSDGMEGTENHTHGGRSLGGAGMEKIIAEFLLDDEGH